MKIGLTLGVLICAAGMVAVAPSGIAQTKSKVHIKIPVVAAKPEDVTLESIVKADYDSISGGVGVPRQWARDLSLYDPHAWTVALSTDPKTGAITTWSFNEQEYADATDAEFVSEGYTERELGHIVHRYGNVATVLSSYEGKSTLTGKAVSRGVNIYQLYSDGKRWWILSIVWDEERPGNSIPPELLPKN